MHVEREVEIIFSGGAVSSDDTWLVFVSHPAEFLCSSWFAMERGEPPTPGAVGAWQSMPRFRLEAVTAVSEEEGGVVRAAMVNTCTSGKSNRLECCASRDFPLIKAFLTCASSEDMQQAVCLPEKSLKDESMYQLCFRVFSGISSRC